MRNRDWTNKQSVLALARQGGLTCFMSAEEIINHAIVSALGCSGLFGNCFRVLAQCSSTLPCKVTHCRQRQCRRKAGHRPAPHLQHQACQHGCQTYGNGFATEHLDIFVLRLVVWAQTQKLTCGYNLASDSDEDKPAITVIFQVIKW